MHAAPDKRAPPVNRLARGSPGGVWARDIPLYRRAVPGHRHGGTQAALLLKPAARSSVVGWMLGVWGGGIRTPTVTVRAHPAPSRIPQLSRGSSGAGKYFWAGFVRHRPGSYVSIV
jgi:hypothetical protein